MRSFQGCFCLQTHLMTHTMPETGVEASARAFKSGSSFKANELEDMLGKLPISFFFNPFQLKPLLRVRPQSTRRWISLSGALSPLRKSPKLPRTYIIISLTISRHLSVSTSLRTTILLLRNLPRNHAAPKSIHLTLHFLLLPLAQCMYTSRVSASITPSQKTISPAFLPATAQFAQSLLMPKALQLSFSSVPPKKSLKLSPISIARS
jgi:hypothetical protein